MLLVSAFAQSAVPGFGAGRGISVGCIAFIDSYIADNIQAVLQHLRCSARRILGALHPSVALSPVYSTTACRSPPVTHYLSRQRAQTST